MMSDKTVPVTETNTPCNCTHLAYLYSTDNISLTLSSSPSDFSRCDCPEIQGKMQSQTRTTELVVLIIVGYIWIFSMMRFLRYHIKDLVQR